jgi:hypothetical protein
MGASRHFRSTFKRESIEKSRGTASRTSAHSCGPAGFDLTSPAVTKEGIFAVILFFENYSTE